MAGAGYKLFNTGDVLTAAQVNTYLMEQTVMVFADATARTTALSGVLAEGMISYLKDTNATEVYNGSAWVGITGDGDITGVTAGTGISGGGTSGTVTITNDMATTITAAGDIVVGTGSGTYDNLPIGTTGQVLTADTTVSPYKVKWATAAAGGTANWSLVNAGGTALTGATTITVSGISGADQIMAVVAGASSANAGAEISFRFNTDTGNNYYRAGAYHLYDSAYAAGNFTNDNYPADSRLFIGAIATGSATSVLSGYCLLTGCNASGVKVFQTVGAANAGGSNGQVVGFNGGIYNSASTITSVSLVSSSGNFDAGTLYVYTTA